MTIGAEIAQQYATVEDTDMADVDSAAKSIGGGDIYDFVLGRNGPFRILPALPGRKPMVKQLVHFVKRPGESAQIVFPCPIDLKVRTTMGTCPVCHYIDALRKTGNPKDRELAQEMRPKLQVFVAAINRKDAEPHPITLRFGIMIWEQLSHLLKDTDTGGNWSDPTEAGYDIVITKSEKKKKVEYAVQAVMRRCALGNMDWIGQAPDLTKYVNPKDPAEIAEMLGIDDFDPSAGAKQIGSGRTAAADIGDKPARQPGDDDDDFPPR